MDGGQLRGRRRGGGRRLAATVVAGALLLGCSGDDGAAGSDEHADDGGPGVEVDGPGASDEPGPADGRPGDGQADDGASDPSDADGDGASLTSLDDYYGQELDWSPCFRRMECTRVLAPLDWAEVDGRSVELFLNRLSATGTPEQRIGSLLINPGGPGGSGVQFVADFARQTISPAAREHYDVVGFDPRGVGLSTPVECDDALVDALVDGLPIAIEDEVGIEQARERHREYGAACLDASGDLLGHVDTRSAARDLDLLRALLGDEQLHYLGYSYGTDLGATYAELFPDRVGRLVLDSAVDPSLASREVALQQAEVLEAALRDYVEDCQAGDDCPLAGSVEDGMAEVVTMIEARDAEPIELAGGRRITGATALLLVYDWLTLADADWSGVTWLLEGWDDEERWAEVLARDEREFDPFSTPGFWASSRAISCLDHPTSVRDLAGARELSADLVDVAPTFGGLLAPGFVPIWLLGCGEWPVAPVREPAPIHAAGAAPILVVGVTGDRRTPYEWSVSLAEQLDSGVLLTWEGDRHGAYGDANDCLHDAVDAYLIDGVLPDDGTVC